jgi:L-threonine kinase
MRLNQAKLGAALNAGGRFLSGDPDNTPHDELRADGAVQLGSATARAPGVCGVLAQGVLGEMPFSVTCPVDFYSRVRVELSDNGPGVDATEDCEKTVAAVRRTLAHLRRAKVRAAVRVSSPIPRGKGLGSSSADLSAAIAATALALGQELSPYDIAQIALSIEPTGGVMLPGLALFDHRAGMVRESLGSPPPMEIVALDFGGSPVSSMDDRTRRWRAVNELTDEALGLIRRGIEENSPALVGQGATMAAEAGSRIESRPRLDGLVAFAREVGAVGVNGGHSDGVSGVLLDATQRRGKSTYIKAQQAFPEAETVYHFRMLSGGVQTVG